VATGALVAAPPAPAPPQAARSMLIIVMSVASLRLLCRMELILLTFNE